MNKEPLNEEIIPSVLAYHGKVLSVCGNAIEALPHEGHFLWEKFNTFAEKHYFRRRESCGVIPMISDGREMLLFFDTFSPDIAPNMQLFFDESITAYEKDTEIPRLLYENFIRGGLSPTVSENIFLEKYFRILTVASFFDIKLSQNSIHRINLREILKKATDLFSEHNSGIKSPKIHMATETAETMCSPISLCAVVLLVLSILGENSSYSDVTSLCVSKHDELFEVSVYTDLPTGGESIAHNDSRTVLCDIFPDKSNEAVLLFRMADSARLSVSYGAEGHRFYISISFKAHALPSSVKALQITENEEKILSILADFLI